MVEDQEDQHFVDGLDVVEAVSLVVEGQLQVAQGQAHQLHDLVQEPEMPLGSLIQEQTDQGFQDDL